MQFEDCRLQIAVAGGSLQFAVNSLFVTAKKVNFHHNQNVVQNDELHLELKIDLNLNPNLELNLELNLEQSIKYKSEAETFQSPQ